MSRGLTDVALTTVFAPPPVSHSYLFGEAVSDLVEELPPPTLVAEHVHRRHAVAPAYPAQGQRGGHRGWSWIGKKRPRRILTSSRMRTEGTQMNYVTTYTRNLHASRIQRWTRRWTCFARQQPGRAGLKFLSTQGPPLSESLFVLSHVKKNFLQVPRIQ